MATIAKNTKGSKKGTGVYFKMLSFVVDDFYFNDKDFVVTDDFRDNLSYAIKPTITFSKKNETITVFIFYELLYRTTAMQSIKTTNVFAIKDYNHSVLLKRDSKGNQKIASAVEAIIDMSMYHTSGAHALKIQEHKEPYLFIPLNHASIEYEIVED